MKKGIVFLLVVIFSLSAAKTYGANSNSCGYIRRCINNIYWYWNKAVPVGDCTIDSGEATRAVRDGEGGVCSSQDRIWIMMDMHASETIWCPQDPSVQITEWNFGLILCYDPSICDTVPVDTIRLPIYSIVYPQATYYGLAYNENDGTFWYSRPYQPNTSPPSPYLTTLYHIDGSGNELYSFVVQNHWITGLAFDADNNHLWCIAQGNPDMFLEYDISTGIPLLIQGPFPVPWSSPTASSAAGLDYDNQSNVLIAVNKNALRLERFKDLEPAYPGPPGPSEPGADFNNSCYINNTPQPWGIAMNAKTQTVFVASDKSGGPRPLDEYSPIEAIPTLTEWGLIIFGIVLLGFMSWVFVKRRKAAVSYQ